MKARFVKVYGVSTLVAIFAAVCPFSVSAENDVLFGNNAVNDVAMNVVDDKEIFTAVEQMPEFPGGDAELMRYLAMHLHYPKAAADNFIQGRVTVQFVVQKDGSVGQVKVVRGKSPELDAEAVRVVKSLPRFIPGKNNGQPVAVWYTLPINFRLTVE